ncbi:MAG: GNAT family N-acetyltransferase [Saprospiraceae bacterium]
MTNKQKHQSFCQSESLPVFIRPWYLDLCCGAENWDVVLVENKSTVLGVLPYHIKKKGPFEMIAMPWLVKMMGPYCAASVWESGKYRKVLTELIEGLPTIAAFQQSFHYQITDWLPFYWKQFQQSTAYSYVLEDLSDLEKVYSNIKSTYRNNKIKKAEQIVQVRSDLSIKDFYDVQKMTFDRQGKDFVIPFSFMEKFDGVVVQNKAGQKFFAVDEQGQVHAVAYLIWDDHTAYHLLEGGNPELRNSGANILLIWETIKYAKEVLGLNRYDFQGSMIPGVEQVRRSFGAKPIPYFQISKEYSTIYKVLKTLRGK